MKYTIFKNDSDSYTLTLLHTTINTDNNNTILFQSLLKTNIIPFGFILSENELYFKAENVTMLKECKELSIEQVLFLIHFLIKQIKYLESRGYTFYGFDIEDVIMINDDTFGIITTDYLTTIEKDKEDKNKNTICFWTPFVKPYFSSPELLNLTTLPSNISYKSCYYSLASLAIYLLWNEYILKGNEIMVDDEIEEIMTPIYNTKLYWFLKRCLHTEGDKRLLFYI